MYIQRKKLISTWLAAVLGILFILLGFLLLQQERAAFPFLERTGHDESH